MTELVQHKFQLADVTPAMAIDILKKGNARFINNMKINRDYLERVSETKDEQTPFAAILSCMDSRAPVETIFDQGLGDVFSVRIAGNVITDNILGCLEFATAVSGSKLIVVMGHTNCGAIKGACDNVKLGNLTSLLEKIKPVVTMENTIKIDRSSKNKAFVDNVAELNVKYSVEKILEQSPIINDLVKKGEIGIIPAMYDIATGKVYFYEEDGTV
jgi:carbonic anhydrase